MSIPGEMYDRRSKLQQLAEIMRKSELSHAAQDDLLSIFSGAGDMELEGVVKFFSNNPAWLPKLAEGCAKKRKAVRSGKKVLWQAILTEEHRQLISLDKT